MAYRLPTDCLNEIFEYLEEDKNSLHSCLLVNRLWCQVAARILWRNVLSYQHDVDYRLTNTLVVCLSDESKGLLYMNRIFIPTPTSNPPLINYISFIKVLSIRKIDRIIENTLKGQQISTSQSLDSDKNLVLKELLKTFMCQISSLKSLDYDLGWTKKVPNIPFAHFPEAKNCLTGLSIFSCSSNVYCEFLSQLSQICHNIQSLTIEFRYYISNGLAELISLQRNLKSLTLLAYEDKDWTDIVPALTKHHNTLITLRIYSGKKYMPLSFIALFRNIQELVISNLCGEVSFEEFKELQHIAFSNLHTLKIPFECPRIDVLMKFLENNGKNLQELIMDGSDRSLKSSVAKFCPNLKKLFIIFERDELDILETIFHSCRRLESIKLWCGDYCLDEKEMLEAVVKHSPKTFYELKIYNDSQSRLLPEDLESFFISWGNRKPQKQLTLITIDDEYSYYDLSMSEGNVAMIEKYKELGVVKKFGSEKFAEE